MPRCRRERAAPLGVERFIRPSVRLPGFTVGVYISFCRSLQIVEDAAIR